MGESTRRASRRVGSALRRLLAVRGIRRAAVQRHVGMRRNPEIANAGAHEGDGGAPSAVERLAVGKVAGRVPHREPDRKQPVRRNHRLRVVEPPVKTVDGRPDIAPLMVFRKLAADHEIGEGAEGDEILREEMPRGGEINRPHMLGKLGKPGLDGREIVGGGGRERHGNPRWQARFVVACYPEAGRGERWRRECQSTPIDVQRVFRGGGWKSSGLATRPCARRDVPTTDSLRKLSKGCVAAKSLDGPISDASPWSNYRFTRASR